MRWAPKFLSARFPHLQLSGKTLDRYFIQKISASNVSA